LTLNISDECYSRDPSAFQIMNTFRICSYSTEIRRWNKEKDLKWSQVEQAKHTYLIVHGKTSIWSCFI